MSVLCTTVISGLDAVGCDQMVGQFGPVLQTASGFVNHVADPSDVGWTVTEVWGSEAHSRAFFDDRVGPNLPPGTSPTIVELHSVLTA